MLWVDAVTTFSPTGWCEKKARPRSPFRAKLSQAALFSSAKKSPRRTFGVKRKQTNFESRGAGGFFYAPNGLNIFCFIMFFNILLSL